MSGKTLDSYLFMQEDLEKGNGHSLVLVLKSIKEDSPQGISDNIVEKMLVEFAESGCPIFRTTTPMSSGSTQKQKNMVNCRFTVQPTKKRLRLFFA